MAPLGVPQGSCLGPLLFTIFVSDIHGLLANSGVNYKLYADDLKLYVEVRDIRDIANMQRAIDLVWEWSIINKMTLSTSKCATMLTSHCGTAYTLNGSHLPKVDHYKDLGVIFDTGLKFRHHVSEIAKSTALLGGLVLRTFITQNPRFYTNLYNAIVV